MISSSITAYCFLKYLKFKYRPLELELFIDIFSKYLSELKWRQLSLADIVFTYKNKAFDQYLNRVNVLLQDNDYNYSFFEGNEHFNQFHLSSADLSVIGYFLEYVGKNSLETEIELCTNVIGRLEEFRNSAEIDYKKTGAFVLKLSFILGLWIAVILI